MGIGDEQLVDEILVLDLGGRAAATAAALHLVVSQALGLGVTAVGKRHYHVLFRNEVLHR